MLAYLLWSLPSVCAYLLVCRGSGAFAWIRIFTIHDELRILIENGFTPYEAIATGAVNASKVVEAMIGEDAFGTIEVGKRADLILVNGNPLENVANVKNIQGVMAAGRWYSKEALELMTTIEQESDP